MKLIPLQGKHAQGRFALVDDQDYEKVKDKRWIYTLTKGGKPYVITAMNGGNMYMHRYILDAKPGEVIDHANADTTDNRRANIRLCTQRLNLANKQVFNSRSPFRGVFLDTARRDRSYKNFWQARIKYLDHTIHLGRYSTAEEAAYVYDQASLQLNGEFARLNVLQV